jgi:hypothetical protein
MKQYVEWAAAAMGVVSAALWFWSSKTRVYWAAIGTLGRAVPSEVLEQVQVQARLSALAALFSSISMALQALAVCLPP